MKKIVIVGYGSIGKRHFKILKKIFPISKIKFFRHKKTLKIPKGSDGNLFNFNEILKFKPQLGVIANPASKHLIFANFFTKNKINFFVEKPLSHNSKGIDALVRNIIKYKVHTFLGYNMRFIPALIYLKKILLTKKYGTIYSIHSEVGSNLEFWRKNKEYQKSVSAKKNLGGGVLLELSHEIDYLYWVFGAFKEVSSYVSKQSKLQINTEDSAMINFILKKNNIIGSLNIDFIRNDPTRICKVICEKGTLSCDLFNNNVYVFKKKSSKWLKLYNMPNADSHYLQWIQFLKNIKKNKFNIEDIKNGKKIVETVEAIKKSSKLKKSIRL